MTEESLPYITYLLEVIKTSAIKSADPYYQEAVDLRVRELRVLRLLHEKPGVTATELRHMLVLDKTLLSKNLAFLEKRGLICRTIHPNDSRQQCLSLSEEGERVWATSEEIGRNLESAMFSQLSRAEHLQLVDLLQRAYASLAHWEKERRSAPSA